MASLWGALPLAVGGVVAVVGFGITALGARELLFAFRVYRGDPTSVAEAANATGIVELSGVAEPDEGTVTAPFSETQSLIFEWEVQERRTDHSGQVNGTYWKTLDEGLLGGPFRLRDVTASWRVEPAGSVRHLGAQFVERRLDPGEDCHVYGRAHYDPTAGRSGGEVNVVVDGEGARRFLVADSRERGGAGSVGKHGLGTLALGLAVLGAGAALALVAL